MRQVIPRLRCARRGADRWVEGRAGEDLRAEVGVCPVGEEGGVDGAAEGGWAGEALEWRGWAVLRVGVACGDDDVEGCSGEIAGWAAVLAGVCGQGGIERCLRTPGDAFDDGGARAVGVGEVAGVDFGVAFVVDVDAVAAEEGVAVLLAGYGVVGFECAVAEKIGGLGGSVEVGEAEGVALRGGS